MKLVYLPLKVHVVCNSLILARSTHIYSRESMICERIVVVVVTLARKPEGNCVLSILVVKAIFFHRIFQLKIRNEGPSHHLPCHFQSPIENHSNGFFQRLEVVYETFARIAV